jgi:hypothetical protein
MSSLSDLAETVVIARRDAAFADNLAGIAIRMLLRKRIEVAVALAQARVLLGEKEWHPWVATLGLYDREAVDTLRADLGAEREEPHSFEHRLGTW